MFQALAFVFASAFSSPHDDAVAPPPQNGFAPPVRVNAGGSPIEHGEAWGHCGPTLRDMDGDGLRDLVVGDFSGRFTVYRNVGSATAPEFAHGVLLQAGGADAHVPIACCIGSSPRFADFDGDGIVDLLSGCYDPGTLWLFPGRERDAIGGTFETGREITDGDGNPLLRVPDQKKKSESYASWLDAVDWDDDGDLDLVVGGSNGELLVFVNAGTRTTPKYLATPTRIRQTDGSFACVQSGHAAVVAADWDDDGLFDLVCGGASGAVVWFRNVGTRGRPRILPPETLVPATPNSGDRVWLEPGAPLQPGIRSQIDVVDWNGDGKLDLLVGDFCTTITPREDLTDEQKRAVASLRLQRETTLAELAKLRAKFGDENSDDKEVQLEKEPTYVAAAKRATELWSELAKLLQKVTGPAGHEARHAANHEARQDDWQTPHGSVWLYVRK